MTYFNKSIATLLSGFVVLMCLWVEGAVAEYIPQLITASVNTNDRSVFDKLVKKLRKDFGHSIKIIKSEPPPYRFPYLDIRVADKGLENSVIRILKKHPLVGAKRIKKTDARLPTTTDNQTYIFSTKVDNKTLFENISQFLTATYQKKCGDCVQAYPFFPYYKKFSITYLNREIVPDKDLVEALEVTFLVTDENEMTFVTLLRGQYADAFWKGKKVIPPGAFQDMADEYPEQLKAYTNEFEEKLKAYLKQ